MKRSMGILRHIPPDAEWRRRFVCYLWFVGWDCISLGLHVCWSQPNIEIHLPFCFIRFGWKVTPFVPRLQLSHGIGLAD